MFRPFFRWGLNRKGPRLRGEQGRAPLIVRHLVINAGLGALFGTGFIAIVISNDIAGIATLLRFSPASWFAFGFLAVGLCASFAALAAGTAIFLLPSELPRDDNGRRAEPDAGAVVPARAPVVVTTSRPR